MFLRLARKRTSSGQVEPPEEDSLAELGEAIDVPLEELVAPYDDEDAMSVENGKAEGSKKSKKTGRSTFLHISLLMVNSSTFYFYTSVFQLIVGPYQPKNGSAVDLYGKIYDTKDVWSYIRTQVFDSLYWDTWYNRRNVSFNERELIGFDNKLLGVPRLRQLRVKWEDCEVPGKMETVVKRCYPAYSPGVRSTEPIIPKGNVTPNYSIGAWTFSTDDKGPVSLPAPIGTYDSSGFVQDLGRSRETSEAILDELFYGRWIDEASRVLVLDFTIYNANINMFVIVRLLFELPYTGGVFVSNEFQPAKLVRYLTATDYFVMACEVLFLVFIFYYIVEETLEIKQHGWKYFRSAWNVLDIVVICNCLACAVFTIYTTVKGNDYLNELLADMNSYPRFDNLSYWYAHFVRATALCVFLIVLKIFKYVNFDRSLGQLTTTLSSAAADLIGFAIMFCIIIFSFVFLGNLAFGAGTEDFSSFTQSCYSLFRMMVGDINFPALQRAHFILGPLFFILFIFFAVFVLLNMFLAIVNDAYSNVKEDLVKQRTQLKLKDMVKKSAKEMINMMRKKTKKTLVQILREADLFGREVIPYEEYRMTLKRYGYGDTEIVSSFIKYDTDGDNCLNSREQQRMEDELEVGVSKAFKQLEEDEGHGTDDEGADGTNQNGSGEQDYMDPQDYKELIERVDALESSVMNMLSHGDQIMAILEQVELAKKEHRRNLMEMFDTLMTRQGGKSGQNST